MKDIHLTAEDFQKYMDTSDMSEAYLVWVEKVNNHLLQCDKCQMVLQKLQLLDSICEDGWEQSLQLAEREEEVRKSILICKLQQMQEQARLAEVIRMLQSKKAVPFVVPKAAWQQVAGVARGEKAVDRVTATGEIPEKLEISRRDGLLTVKVAEPEEKQFVTVVVNREKAEPIVCEAKWNEQHKQWIAEITLDEDGQIEAYIL